VKNQHQQQLDLVRGAEAIGALFGMDERQAYNALEKGHIKGAFKMGKIWMLAVANARRQAGLDQAGSREQAQPTSDAK
jgi:hypothetical protein